jgi:hypothetical protein
MKTLFAIALLTVAVSPAFACDGYDCPSDLYQSDIYGHRQDQSRDDDMDRMQRDDAERAQQQERDEIEREHQMDDESRRGPNGVFSGQPIQRPY